MRSWLLFCITVGLSLAIAAWSKIHVEVRPPKVSLFEYLRSAQNATLHLSFDIERYLSNGHGKESCPGILSVNIPNQKSVVLGCDVMIRGDYRRKHCQFPPYELNFDADELKNRSFRKFDDFKFVTHCMDNRRSSQTLIKEYLAYQIYATLTDSAYHSLLLPTTYLDIASRKRYRTLSIMLESDDGLQNRLGGKWHSKDALDPSQVDSYPYELFALFQYLIGNRDVNIATGKNVKVLKSKFGFIPIPYDFDFSLFVDAPYAFPTEADKVPRLHFGLKENQHVLEKVIAQFQAKKGDIRTLIQDNALLKSTERKNCIAQIDAFYQELESLFK